MSEPTTRIGTGSLDIDLGVVMGIAAAGHGLSTDHCAVALTIFAEGIDKHGRGYIFMPNRDFFDPTGDEEGDFRGLFTDLTALLAATLVTEEVSAEEAVVSLRGAIADLNDGRYDVFFAGAEYTREAHHRTHTPTEEAPDA